MEYTIIGIVAIIFIIAISYLAKSLKSTSHSEYLYQKRKSFFTANELAFYRNLTKAITGMNLVIFSKTRLADIIEPKKGIKNWTASFNKIRSKHIDFILCSLPDINPVLMIELDDKSHQRPDRKERDSFVDQALAQAGIPILHVMDSTNITEKIKKAISKTKTPTLPRKTN